MSCNLYLLSPPEISNLQAFIVDLEKALATGRVACFQLRLKSPSGQSAPDDQILRVTEALLPIARRHEVALLINDRPDLAKISGADGVHLGQSDASLKEARALLGEDASIGVTCHDSRHLGLVAGEAGADYVAFGAFFATSTKAAPTRAEPDLLRWWSEATTVPCVAIGGITPENCAELVRAGADFLAVSGAVWAHSEGPDGAIRQFHRVIEATASP